MPKEKLKNLLDFVPLFILIISAVVMVWQVYSNDTNFLIRQSFGLLALLLDILLFLRKHKLGVIAVGVTIVSGIFGLISLSYAISTDVFSVGREGSMVTIFRGQSIFLLWFIIYFVFCNRHFYLINTKKYWKDLFAKK